MALKPSLEMYRKSGFEASNSDFLHSSYNGMLQGQEYIEYTLWDIFYILQNTIKNVSIAINLSIYYLLIANYIAHIN